MVLGWLTSLSPLFLQVVDLQFLLCVAPAALLVPQHCALGLAEASITRSFETEGGGGRKEGACSLYPSKENSKNAMEEGRA